MRKILKPVDYVRFSLSAGIVVGMGLWQGWIFGIIFLLIVINSENYIFSRRAMLIRMELLMRALEALKKL